MPGRESLGNGATECPRILNAEPVRASKAALLEDLRDSGVFLIDLKTDPKRPGEALDDHADDLVARAKAVAPEHVIAIKANVWDLCQRPLRAAGLSVADVRVPFPGGGRQTEFLKAMGRALESIGWHPLKSTTAPDSTLGERTSRCARRP